MWQDVSRQVKESQGVKYWLPQPRGKTHPDFIGAQLWHWLFWARQKVTSPALSPSLMGQRTSTCRPAAHGGVTGVSQELVNPLQVLIIAGR